MGLIKTAKCDKCGDEETYDKTASEIEQRFHNIRVYRCPVYQTEHETAGVDYRTKSILNKVLCTACCEQLGILPLVRDNIKQAEEEAAIKPPTIEGVIEALVEDKVQEVMENM